MFYQIKNMATVQDIFNYISSMNPKESVISSMGTFIDKSSQDLADGINNEVIGALPQDTLAYKIATSLTDRYTDKQLWVIAFELKKNATFLAKIEKFYSELNRKSNAKIEASKAKLTANKEASSDVLAMVKNSGKKLGDYYKWLNTSGNAFRKEFFSKKYSIESVTTFINL